MKPRYACAFRITLVAFVLATSGACASRANRSDTVQATSRRPTTTETQPSDEAAEVDPAPQQAVEVGATTNPTRTCDMQVATSEEFAAAHLNNRDGTVSLEDAAIDPPNAEAHPSLAVHGSLSKEVIRRIIRRHINEIHDCFARALSNYEGSARVDMRFVIMPGGRVGGVGLMLHQSSWPQLPCCVAEALRTWTFPPPEGGGTVLVTFPFIAHGS